LCLCTFLISYLIFSIPPSPLPLSSPSFAAITLSEWINLFVRSLDP
jgi:hypothetical protein